MSDGIVDEQQSLAEHLARQANEAEQSLAEADRAQQKVQRNVQATVATPLYRANERLSTSTKTLAPHWDRDAVLSAANEQLESLLPLIMQEPLQRRAGKNWFYGEKNGSLSVIMKGERRGSWKDFAGTDRKGNILDLIMDQKNVDFKEALRLAAQWTGTQPTLRTDNTKVKRKAIIPPVDKPQGPTEEQQQRMSHAQNVMAQTRPIMGTLAERYLTEHRGLKNIPSSIQQHFKFHPNVKYGKRYYPALIVPAASKKGDVQMVQRILLNADTAGNIKNEKGKNVKPMLGSSIYGTTAYLQRGTSNVSMVGEGPETMAVIAALYPDADVKASLGVSNFTHFDPTELADNVIICADHTDTVDGEYTIENNVITHSNYENEKIQARRSTMQLAERLHAAGKNVTVAMPGTAAQDDFNKVYQLSGEAGVRAIIDNAPRYAASNEKEKVATVENNKVIPTPEPPKAPSKKPSYGMVPVPKVMTLPDVALSNYQIRLELVANDANISRGQLIKALRESVLQEVDKRGQRDLRQATMKLLDTAVGTAYEGREGIALELTTAKMSTLLRTAVESIQKVAREQGCAGKLSSGRLEGKKKETDEQMQWGNFPGPKPAAQSKQPNTSESTTAKAKAATTGEVSVDEEIKRTLDKIQHRLDKGTTGETDDKDKEDDLEKILTTLKRVRELNGTTNAPTRSGIPFLGGLGRLFPAKQDDPLVKTQKEVNFHRTQLADHIQAYEIAQKAKDAQGIKQFGAEIMTDIGNIKKATKHINPSDAIPEKRRGMMGELATQLKTDMDSVKTLADKFNDKLLKQAAGSINLIVQWAKRLRQTVMAKLQPGMARGINA